MSRNESNRHLLAGIGDKKIFHELEGHHVSKLGTKRFWLRCRNKSNRYLLAGIGENIIFHELDVHHV